LKNVKMTIVMMILASAAALADTSTCTATLAQPLAAKKQVIANANMWRCAESSCVLVSQPTDAGAIHSCYELQRQVGQVTGYVYHGTAFDADKLAKCNAKT
jgi:hypothetical protein